MNNNPAVQKFHYGPDQAWIRKSKLGVKQEANPGSILAHGLIKL